jgi:hypothetical protein
MANLEYLHAKLFSEKMGISEGVLARRRHKDAT